MIKQLLGFDEKTPITMSIMRLLIAAIIFGWSAYAWANSNYVPLKQYERDMGEIKAMFVEIRAQLYK